MSKVLIVNYFGGNAVNPGGRRTQYWKGLLERLGWNVEVSEFQSERPSQLVRLVKRLVNITPFRVVMPDMRWVRGVQKYIERESFDLVILCVPHYDVLDILRKKVSGVRYWVDLRDGIYYESLYTGAERFFLSGLLRDYEGLLGNADYLTSNVPGLIKYYTKVTGKKIGLVYGVTDEVINTSPHSMDDDCDISILFAGGLMRSSRGLNIDKLLLARERFAASGGRCNVTLVGRFNRYEKVKYKSVAIIDEIPVNELHAMLGKYDCMLVVNTTDRDLLPSKFWMYVRTCKEILSIGGSYSIKIAAREFAGVAHVADDVEEISRFLASYKRGKVFDRSEELYRMKSRENTMLSQMLDDASRSALSR